MKFMRSFTICESTCLQSSAVHKSGPSGKSWKGSNPRVAKAGCAVSSRTGSAKGHAFVRHHIPVELEAHAELFREGVGAVQHGEVAASGNGEGGAVGPEPVLLAGQAGSVVKTILTSVPSDPSGRISATPRCAYTHTAGLAAARRTRGDASAGQTTVYASRGGGGQEGEQRAHGLFP
ncbi:MAG: hypothetical protein U1F87_13035 [Kiritimatiellia bacterium]